MTRDDQGDKTQLWTLTLEVAKRIIAHKTGAQIKVSPFTKQHIQHYSAGYYFHLAHLMKGGGSLGLYLDRYSGLPQPRFWYGLYTESESRLAAFESVARSIVPGRPLHFGDKDSVADPYEHLKVPLSTFDRLLVERYSTDGTYYCGLYSPYTVPLSVANRRDLVSEASRFLLECARRLLESHGPTRGKKAKTTPPSSRKSEQAAIRFVRKALKASKPPYHVKDRQRTVCGYDLLATRQKQPSELHVEVKGAVGVLPRFFLSETEYDAARDARWRLAIVTRATSKPTFTLMTPHEVKARFTLRPIQWEGGPKEAK